MTESESGHNAQGEPSSVLLGELHQRFEQALNVIACDSERRQPPPDSPGIKGPVTMAKANRDGYTYVLLRMPETPEVELTQHQREILRLVSLGMPDKAIADELKLAATTIGVHLKRLNKRTDSHSRTALVMRCLPYLQA